MFQRPLGHLTDDELFRRLVADYNDIEAQAEAVARWYYAMIVKPKHSLT